MRQVQLDRFGGPEVLHEVEVGDRRPGRGEVVVQTTAAGITFVETQLRAGRSPGAQLSLPAVLGNGVEGVVVQAGDSVDPAILGRRVVTATGGTGGYADRVVVDAGNLIAVADGLRDGDAVALLADGRTALALARAAQITADDVVLITAAAGGVGTLLLQLARTAGARTVVAAAGGDRKLAVARELGADIAVDYRQPGWAEDVRENTGEVDVAFDGVGGDLGRSALGLVHRGGRFVVYGASSGTFTDLRAADDLGVTCIPGYAQVRSPQDNRALVEQALAEAAAGRLRPVIGQRFALSDAADAHAAIEARATVGKTLLIPR